MIQKLPLLIVFALLLAGGVFWLSHEKAIAPTIPVQEPTQEPSQEPTDTTDSKYSPQHIVSIPGKTDRVWYEIPEMGIKLLLSKETAEDTVYQYGQTKQGLVSTDPKTKEKEFVDVSYVTLSSKQVIDYNQRCDNPLCGTDAYNLVIRKIQGIFKNHPLAFGSNFLKQFKDFYLITGGSPQAVPFANEEEEKKFNAVVHLPSIPPLTKMDIEIME